MNDGEFVLTDDHIKLLRRAHVGWQDCETGAPEINPKRPYGNSAVAADVAEILGIKRVDTDDGPMLTREDADRCRRLHRETESALQVVLATGEFTPGTYRRASRYSATSWVRVK